MYEKEEDIYHFDDLDKHPIVGWSRQQSKELWCKRQVISRILTSEFTNHAHGGRYDSYHHRYSSCWIYHTIPRPFTYMDQDPPISLSISESWVVVLPGISKTPCTEPEPPFCVYRAENDWAWKRGLGINRGQDQVWQYGIGRWSQYQYPVERVMPNPISMLH